MMGAALPEKCRLFLTACGKEKEASRIDVGLAVLYLSAVHHPGIGLERYENHIEKLTVAVGAHYKQRLEESDDDSPEARLSALHAVLAVEYDYDAERENPSHIQNADMIAMIDRRRGASIALAILYFYVAQAQGWDCAVLNMAGHFVMRLGQNLIFDPSDHCRILQASALRALVKKMQGPEAELSATYYEPLDSRALLVALQNFVKFRQIEHEDYGGALQTVGLLKQIAPDEYRLLFEEGILYMRTGQIEKARTALEDYIERTPNLQDRYEAQLLLQTLPETVDT